MTLQERPGCFTVCARPPPTSVIIKLVAGLHSPVHHTHISFIKFNPNANIATREMPTGQHGSRIMLIDFVVNLWYSTTQDDMRHARDERWGIIEQKKNHGYGKEHIDHYNSRKH